MDPLINDILNEVEQLPSPDFSPQNAYKYMRDSNVSDYHARGILANIKSESSFKPGIREPRANGGLGLFQYTEPTRKNNFLTAVPDWEVNWRGQIDHALNEDLTKAYLSKQFKTPEEASEWFTINWERPQNYMQKAKERSKHVKTILGNNELDDLLTEIENTPVLETPKQSSLDVEQPIAPPQPVEQQTDTSLTPEVESIIQELEQPEIPPVENEIPRVISPGGPGAIMSDLVPKQDFTKDDGSLVVEPVKEAAKRGIRSVAQITKGFSEVSAEAAPKHRQQFIENAQRLREIANNETNPDKKATAEKEAEIAEQIVQLHSEDTEFIKKVGEKSDKILNRFAEDKDFKKLTGVKGWIQDLVMAATILPFQVASTAINPALGVAFMGTQVAGGSYEDLREKGVEPERAAKASLVNAAIQAPLEAIGLGKAFKAWKVAGKKGLTILKDIASAGAVEGLTEFIQEYPQAVSEIWATTEGKSNNERVEMFLDQSWDIFKNALQSGSIGAALGTGTASVGAVSSIKQQPVTEPGETVKNTDENVKELKVPVKLTEKTPVKPNEQINEESVENKPPVKLNVRESLIEGKNELNEINSKIDALNSQIKQTPKGKDQRKLVKERKNLTQQKQELLNKPKEELLKLIDGEMGAARTIEEIQGLQQAIKEEMKREGVARTPGELSELNNRYKKLKDKDPKIEEMNIAQEAVEEFFPAGEKTIKEIITRDAGFKKIIQNSNLTKKQKNRVIDVLSDTRDGVMLDEKGVGIQGRRAYDKALEGLYNLIKEKRLKDFSVFNLDIVNLGGMNNAVGHDGANIVLRDVVNIIRKHISNLGHNEIYKMGGDEVAGITTATKAELASAMFKAKKEINEYISEKDLDGVKLKDLPHPKHGDLPTGAGRIVFGVKNSSESLDFRSLAKNVDDDASMRQRKEIVDLKRKFGYIEDEDAKIRRPDGSIKGIPTRDRRVDSETADGKNDKKREPSRKKTGKITTEKTFEGEGFTDQLPKINPPKEPNYQKISHGKRQRETFDEIYTRATRKKSFKEKTADNIKSVSKSIKNLGSGKEFDKTLIPISTRLKEINPKLKEALRKYESKLGTRENAFQKKVLPFLTEKSKTMSDEDLIIYDYAERNRDVDKISELNKKYNLTKQYEAKREVLADLYEKGIKAGFDIGYMDDFAPRLVKDYDGLVEYLKGTKDWSEIEKSVSDLQENQADPLSADQVADVINRWMRGYGHGMREGKPGAVKSRKLNVVDDVMSKFYDTSDNSLLHYIKVMNEAISAKEFFGRTLSKDENGKIDVDDSIGRYTLDLILNKEINQKQEKELRDILQARFNPGRMGAGVGFFRNFAYMTTLAQLSPTLTQIGDLAWSISHAGPIKTVKAALKKNKITPEQVGLNELAVDMMEASRSSKALKALLKSTGFATMDKFGVTTFINATMEKYHKMAKKDPKRLLKELRPTFEGKTNKVFKDFLNNEYTDDVGYKLFSDVLDYQPRKLSEVPEYYLRSGNAKIFWMLKTWTSKMLGIWREQVYDEIKSGNVKKGTINFAKYAGTLMALQMSSDELKDWLMGRTSDLSERVTDNILKLFGVSRYVAWKARDEGIQWAAAKMVLPPARFFDSVLEDIVTIFDKDKDLNFENLETIKEVPPIGSLLYWRFGAGKRKNEFWQEKKRKEKNKKSTSQKIKTSHPKVTRPKYRRESYSR